MSVRARSVVSRNTLRRTRRARLGDGLTPYPRNLQRLYASRRPAPSRTLSISRGHAEVHTITRSPSTLEECARPPFPKPRNASLTELSTRYLLGATETRVHEASSGRLPTVASSGGGLNDERPRASPDAHCPRPDPVGFSQTLSRAPVLRSHRESASKVLLHGSLAVYTNIQVHRCAIARSREYHTTHLFQVNGPDGISFCTISLI